MAPAGWQLQADVGTAGGAQALGAAGPGGALPRGDPDPLTSGGPGASEPTGRYLARLQGVLGELSSWGWFLASARSSSKLLAETLAEYFPGCVFFSLIKLGLWTVTFRSSWNIPSSGCQGGVCCAPSVRLVNGAGWFHSPCDHLAVPWPARHRIVVLRDGQFQRVERWFLP